jgi:hypothetical protein
MSGSPRAGAYDPAQYVRLVGLYVKAGERERAAEWLARLCALDPANPEIAALSRRAEEGQ